MSARAREAPRLAPAIEFFGSSGDYAELSDAMDARVRSVLASGQVLQGAAVASFEERVAEVSGRRYAVAVGSGTDALFFALVAAGIGPGDEVLVPSVTFVASASAILRTGAKPVFVDMARLSEIDLDAADDRVSSRTRALVHVHLFGGMNDPGPIERFTERHGLVLIEDFAQSFGASHCGRRAGSLGFAGATSFDPTKVIGAPGSGGALVTDDEAVAEKARRLRLHSKSGPEFAELGYNSQLATIGAAILDLKVDCHPQWTERRRQVAVKYMEGLSGLPVEFWPHDERTHHVWHKFVIMTDQRDALAASLRDRGIPTRVHYERPLHREPLFAAKQTDEEFPNAMSYCRRTISLPIHSHLTADAVEFVIAGVRDFFFLH